MPPRPADGEGGPVNDSHLCAAAAPHQGQVPGGAGDRGATATVPLYLLLSAWTYFTMANPNPG